RPTLQARTDPPAAPARALLGGPGGVPQLLNEHGSLPGEEHELRVSEVSVLPRPVLQGERAPEARPRQIAEQVPAEEAVGERPSVGVHRIAVVLRLEEVLEGPVLPVPRTDERLRALGAERRGEEEGATRGEDTVGLGEGPPVVRDVLQDVEAEHVVEALVGERERLEILVPNAADEIPGAVLAREVLAPHDGRMPLRQPLVGRGDALGEVDPCFAGGLALLLEELERGAQPVVQTAPAAGEVLAPVGDELPVPRAVLGVLEADLELRRLHAEVAGATDPERLLAPGKERELDLPTGGGQLGRT